MSSYAGMANNPLSYIDPDGRDPITASVIIGSALVGGGMNVWANWSKIKGWKQGLAYFGTGAIGGVTTVLTGGNAALGGAITSGGNVIVDLAGGNLPHLKTGSQIAGYAAEQVAMGAVFGYAGGKLGEFVGKGINSFTAYFQKGFVSLQPFSETINGVKYYFDGIAGVVSKQITIGGSIGGSVAKGGSTKLYRAVSKGELDDIAQNGFRLKEGGYDSGKLFANSLEDATKFGQNNYFNFDKIPNHLVEVKIPTRLYDKLYQFPADNMTAINVRSGLLSQLNKAGKINFLNYSPLIPR